MYAVVGTWLMDTAQQEMQDRVLHEQIVPMVKQAPGFVSAYWGRAVDRAESVSFVVFDDRAAAEGFAANVDTDPEDRGQVGVEPSGRLTIVEISATA
jgi:hypothetical protein